MTIGEKHNAIASQYYKELENAKANATIYHYTEGSSDKPNKQIIKNWLKKRGCNNLSDFLNYEEMF